MTTLKVHHHPGPKQECPAPGTTSLGPLPLADGYDIAQPGWATIWRNGETETAAQTQSEDILQTHWVLFLPSICALGGGVRRVFLVIFKCLKPLIETSETAPPTLSPKGLLRHDKGHNSS